MLSTLLTQIAAASRLRLTFQVFSFGRARLLVQQTIHVIVQQPRAPEDRVHIDGIVSTAVKLFALSDRCSEQKCAREQNGDENFHFDQLIDFMELNYHNLLHITLIVISLRFCFSSLDFQILTFVNKVWRRQLTLNKTQRSAAA